MSPGAGLCSQTRFAQQTVETDWNTLRALASAEVRATLRRLPLRLRRQAEPRPNAALIEDGYDPGLLGLFVGTAFADEESGAVDLPPQILLFLENLWDFAGQDETVYREEVRTTYLHELGHYLGLDEIDLEERGLD